MQLQEVRVGPLDGRQAERLTRIAPFRVAPAYPAIAGTIDIFRREDAGGNQHIRRHGASFGDHPIYPAHGPFVGQGLTRGGIGEVDRLAPLGDV